MGKLDTFAYYLMCLSLDLLHALIWLIYVSLLFLVYLKALFIVFYSAVVKSNYINKKQFGKYSNIANTFNYMNQNFRIIKSVK